MLYKCSMNCKKSNLAKMYPRRGNVHRGYFTQKVKLPKRSFEYVKKNPYISISCQFKTFFFYINLRNFSLSLSVEITLIIIVLNIHFQWILTKMWVISIVYFTCIFVPGCHPCTYWRPKWYSSLFFYFLCKLILNFFPYMIFSFVCFIFLCFYTIMNFLVLGVGVIYFLFCGWGDFL